MRNWNVALGTKGIYFLSQRGVEGASLKFLSFVTNKVTTLSSIANSLSAVGGLAVTPDDQWLLYTQIEHAGSELMLVENFR